MFIIWCWNILSLLGFWHVGEVAEYYYTFSEHEVFMEFRINQHELDHLNIDVKGCNYSQMQALCLSKYLEGNQTLKIDGHPISFNLDQSFTKDGHYILHLKGTNPNANWQNLELTNQCFYKLQNGFKNRIILVLPEGEKSYMLYESQSKLNFNR